MKIYSYIKLAIYAAFAVLIVVLKDTLLENLHYLIASLMIAYGTETALLSFFTKKKKCLEDIKFFLALGEVSLGLVLMTSIREFAYVCILWAVWTMVREMIEIYEFVAHKHFNVFGFIDFAESIVSITFCVLLLIDPSYHHAHTHMFLLIVEVLVMSLSPVLSDIFENLKKKKDDSKIES